MCYIVKAGEAGRTLYTTTLFMEDSLQCYTSPTGLKLDSWLSGTSRYKNKWSQKWSQLLENKGVFGYNKQTCLFLQVGWLKITRKFIFLITKSYFQKLLFIDITIYGSLYCSLWCLMSLAFAFSFQILPLFQTLSTLSNLYLEFE